MLKLVQTDWGVFDLAFDDPALNDSDAAAATLIYGVLFTDAEAPVDRVDDLYNRGGWYADPEAGTGLWYVRRQALDAAARQETVSMIRTALTARAPALTDVDVQDITLADPAGSVSSVFVEITGLHNGRKFLVKVAL